MDYAILARPRIRLDTFRAILARAGSPALDDAADVYRACVGYGVDPAVLLAVFQHESSYGRAGVARSSRSWGNLRRSPGYPTVDGFARYPTWAAGGADTARLLRVYAKNLIRPGRDTSTVQRFPYVWAPTADGNAPDSYGDACVRAITGYIALDRRTPADAPTHPTHRCIVAGTRLRARSSLAGEILPSSPAPVGAVARATVVIGGRYAAAGTTSTRWLRITALNGRRLPAPIYSAALLWAKL